MAFPATTPTSQPQASALLSNNAANAGLTNATPFDRLTNLEQVVANLLTDLPAGINITSAVPGTQALTAAGAASVTVPVTTIVGPAASTYAITLAAPSAPGITKVITMLSTTSTNTVTLALTNVVGGTQTTTATFDAAGETLILVSNATKWVVVKEYGVTLS